VNVKRFSVFVGLPLILICAILYQLVTYRLNEDLAINAMTRISVAQKNIGKVTGKANMAT
jgi:hypothetical protein